MVSQILFQSAKCEWATPPDLFARLAEQYGPLDVDVCALPENAKRERYFSPEQDGLKQPWQGRCWMNPPYGETLGRWVRKAWESSMAGATVVCLLPSRTSNRWWHDYVLPYGEVEYIRGRVKFGDATNGAPFGSAVVVFRPGRVRQCRGCGNPFRPPRADAKFCSAACKQATYRARKAAGCVTDKPSPGDGEEASLYANGEE